MLARKGAWVSYQPLKSARESVRGHQICLCMGRMNSERFDVMKGRGVPAGARTPLREDARNESYTRDTICSGPPERVSARVKFLIIIAEKQNIL